MDISSHYINRIHPTQSLDSLLEEVARQYSIYIQFADVVKVGYDDLNIKVQTNTDQAWLLKIFCKEKSSDICDSNASIINAAQTVGVRTPAIKKNQDGKYISDIEGNNIMLLEFINGGDYYSNNYYPNKKDIYDIIDQQNLFHKIEYQGISQYNSWCLLNIRAEFEFKSSYLLQEEKDFVVGSIKKFDCIDFPQLPSTLIHGDILRCNLVRDSAQKNWLLDFGSSEFAPRIIDPLVVFTDVLFDPDDWQKTEGNFVIAWQRYSTIMGLTNYEKEIFSDLLRVAFANNLLNARYEFEHGNTTPKKESLYWLNKSFSGLQFLTQTINIFKNK